MDAHKQLRWENKTGSLRNSLKKFMGNPWMILKPYYKKKKKTNYFDDYTQKSNFWYNYKLRKHFAVL